MGNTHRALPMIRLAPSRDWALKGVSFSRVKNLPWVEWFKLSLLIYLHIYCFAVLGFEHRILHLLDRIFTS
jgi:hypothetical protein